MALYIHTHITIHNVCISKCMCISINVYVCVCVSVCVCMCVCVCVCVYLSAHALGGGPTIMDISL